MNRSALVMSGPGFFLAGLKMLFKPALRWFVLLPLLINIGVFGAMVYWAFGQLASWMDFWLGWLPQWLGFIEYILWPLFFFGVSAMVFFAFTVVGNLLASPFNALLSEKVQRLEGAKLPDMSLKDWLVVLPRSLGRELKKLSYYLPRAMVLLVISFVPLANLASPFLWFIFNAWMMAVQYCDYAADNRMVSFRSMIRQLRQNPSGVWSFGATVSLVMWIPLINLLIMPAAVVGSALLWERRIQANTGEH